MDNQEKKEAIILAGGKGTRLKSVVSDLPKPMASVANKPFITYVLDELIKFGFSKAILSVGFMHQKIIDALGFKYHTLDLEYSIENKALGTGGAIKKALEKISTGNVLILNGDTLFKINITHLLKQHLTKEAVLTMALKEINKPERYGTVLINEHQKIISFREKNKDLENGLINGGIYYANKIIKTYLPNKDTFSFETDFLQAKYKEISLYGVVFPDYFIDIGIPEDYLKAQKDLQK